MLTHKDSSKDRRSVAPVFVQEALACGQRANVNIPQVLREAAVTPDQLDRLSTQEYGRIWLALSQHMSDEFFGLGARAMRPGSIALLGHAIQGAKTLEVALKRKLRFLKMSLDDPHASFTVEGSDCVITVSAAPTTQQAFACRTFFLILHGFNCWSAQERIPIKSMTFSCEEPKDKNDYADFFGTSVSFNAASTTMVFDRKYLNRKASRTDKELKTFLRSLPEAFLRGYRDTVGLKHMIIETCLQGPPNEWPDATEVAQHLGMSRSTLHRLLKGAGHSLTQLKNEQRRNRATALLLHTDLSISEVSAAVGYAEEGAFYRAFHRWYQTTPSHLRARPRKT